MTSETSCQTARRSRESFPEEAETMISWNQEFERIDRCQADKHEENHKYEHEDDLIDSKIFGSYVSRLEPSGGPTDDYVICSEVERLVKDNIKPTVKVAMARIVLGLVDDTIENVFK